MPVNGIIGKKVGMTQLFDNKGDVRPVTVLQAGPCVVTQRKTAAKDGYEVAQIGLVEFVKGKHINKPMGGHFAKHNLPPVRVIREVDIEVEAPKAQADQDASDGVKIGDKGHVDMCDGGRVVDINGTSKSRGWECVVRHSHT